MKSCNPDFGWNSYEVRKVKKTMVLMIGLQGSGKSTFCQSVLGDAYVRINLDTLKTRHRESLLLQECMEQGKSFVIDNTNPTREDRLRYIPLAKAAGYRIVGYFMESKLKTCLERNAQREGKAKIPSTAIAATSNRLQMPSYAEGFDALYFVKNDGTSMRVEKWRE